MFLFTNTEQRDKPAEDDRQGREVGEKGFCTAYPTQIRSPLLLHEGNNP
jgi:hypothetical protein